jgi:hypothetical protein
MFTILVIAASLAFSFLFVFVAKVGRPRPNTLEQNAKRFQAASDYVVQETRPWEDVK